MNAFLLAALISQPQVLEPRLQLAFDGRLPSTPEVAVFVRSYDPVRTAARIARLGGSVGTLSGVVLTARLPLAALDEVAQGPDVLRVEEGRRVRERLDEARAWTGVDKVLQGVEPLEEPYDGSGVVVGVADRGLDWGHPAFAGRIDGLWDHGGAGADGPKGYGSVCNASELLEGGGCPHISDDPHGTHVSSIAVGAAEPYVGVAPGARLLFVHLGTDPPGVSGDEAKSTAVCDAVDWIFAQAGDRPAVANLSLGSHEGPHDGSSLASECVNGLTGPGRVVVAAAGNEAAGGIHPGTGDKTWLHARGLGGDAPRRVAFRANAAVDAQVSVWIPSGAEAEVRVGFGDQVTSSLRAGDDSVDAELPVPGEEGGAVTVILLGTDQADGQRRVEAYIVGGDGPLEVRDTLEWFLEVRSDATWDAYLDVVEGHGFVEGEAVSPDGSSSIGFPAIARDVIAVGAHRSRVAWSSARAGDQSVSGAAGDLSPFSGRGPSRDDGRSGFKPSLVAPGEVVVAALSQHAAQGALADHVVEEGPGGWAAFAGTSMASPFVAGVVALMLQVDPDLEPHDVRDVLRDTASTEGIGVPLPDPGWGFGRLDAAAAVAKVVADDGLSDGLTDLGFEDPVLCAGAGPTGSPLAFPSSWWPLPRR